MSKRDKFEVSVRNVSPDELGVQLKATLQQALNHWPPNTMMTLFVSDFGAEGGLAYISNAQRDDMIQVVREWLKRQETLA